MARKLRANVIDLKGKTFGRLTVLAFAFRNNKHGQPFWKCKCMCGTKKEVLGANLRSGNSKSCGCLAVEHSQAKLKLIDRKGDFNGRTIAARAREGANYVSSGDAWYKLASGRYYAARRRKIELGFSSPHDLATYCKSIAPKVCPVFGKPLNFQTKGFHPWSYNIDRRDPSLGYVRGSIQILSTRANLMKRDASPEELRMFAKWVLR